MAWFMGDSTDPDVVALRRRVALLERQVAALAEFTGIDPNHLPAPSDPVSERARALVAQGHLIKAIKAHREDTGLDLVTAKRDIDAVARGSL